MKINESINILKNINESAEDLGTQFRGGAQQIAKNVAKKIVDEFNKDENQDLAKCIEAEIYQLVTHLATDFDDENAVKMLRHAKDTVYKSSELHEGLSSDFFADAGLELAKSVADDKGTLKSCKEVSEAVANEARENGIDCKSIDVGVTSKDKKLINKLHTVILVKDVSEYLVDYTCKQYFGSNNPEDVEYIKIPKYNKDDDFYKDTFYNEDLGLWYKIR